jgi:hypothetical protein
MRIHTDPDPQPWGSATLITPTWCSCQECSSCVPYSMYVAAVQLLCDFHLSVYYSHVFQLYVRTTSMCCECPNLVCYVAVCVLFPRFPAVCEYNFHVLRMSKSCVLCSCPCIIPTFCSCEYNFRMLQMSEYKFWLLRSCLCITPRFAAVSTTSVCCRCQNLVCYVAVCALFPCFVAVCE